MAFLDTKYKRKSAVITSFIALMILLLILTFGLTYFDPPKEYGIAVNFGTSSVGSGNVQPTEALKPATTSESESQPVEEMVEEVVEESADAEPSEESEPSEDARETESEKVITQESAEAIAIKKAEEVRKIREAKAKEEARKKAEAEKKAEEERQRKIREENERKERERQEQEAKRKNLDALMGGFSDSNGNAEGGEGDDNQPGDKGKETGDPNASGYYGIGGDGSGGNYRLGNRKAIAMPKPDYECNEEGRVVVSITVDQTGRVIAAQPGGKGTTTSASCLWEEAKEAALKTKFNADSNAPARQLGEIIYNFSLSD